MKLHLKTSHKISLRATPENGDAYEASMFIKPYVTIDCPALWDWLKEKLNIRESENESTRSEEQEDT